MKMFRKMKGKLGFTLAEMLIVVALLAIIMAIAAPNVAKYSKSIKQRELDDSARSIYMAFEHQFASDVEMGVDLKEGNSLGIKLENEWNGKSGIVDKPSRYDGTDKMGYIIYKYEEGSSLTNIVESELDHNSYIIEFNPETGDVFGVFYADLNTINLENEYNESTYNDPDCLFDKLARYKKGEITLDQDELALIGYYGGDGNEGDRINDDTLPKPIVKIINKEKLVVTIENGGSGSNPVNVSIKLGDKEIVDNKKQLTPNLTATFILDSLSTNPKPTINNGVLSETPYETNIKTWLDDVAPSCEDMTLTVTFSDPEGKMKDQTVTKTFNPLFADGSTADMAYIEYGRHLQNLDKAKDPTAPPTEPPTVPRKAVVRKTIDFAKEPEDPDNVPEYEYWKQVYGDKKFTPLTIKKIDISAPGVEIKNINIKGIKGTDNKLRAGLFVRSADGFYAHDIIFRNPIIEGDNAWAGAVAAVLEKGGKAENITVINPQFDATTDDAGGIAGYARKCTIKNCQVYVEKTDDLDWSDPMNDPYSKYTISANRYAGGIVGGTEGLVTNGATIENCIAAVKVVSKSVGIDESAAGGLVGKASNTTVIDSAVFGHTYEGAFDGTYLKPAENPADPHTEETFDLRNNVYGKYNAGGLIGKSYQGNKFSGIVFSTCSVMGTVKVDTAYNGTAPNIDSTDPNTLVYTLGTAYKGTEKTTKSADPNIKSAADDEIAISEDEAAANPELVPVAQRYDSKVSAKFKFKVPQSVTQSEPDGKMILRGDWPTEEESVSGFFYWEKEVEEKEVEGTKERYHVKALYYNGLDPNNENSEEPEKEVKELINNLCYEKDGNSITEYGYGAFKLDSDPDIKYQKAKYTSNMGNIYKGTFGWDYAGSYGKIEYSDIQLTDILDGDKIENENVPQDIKDVINDELEEKFKASSIDVSNIKYVMYKEKSGENNGWTKAGTVKATLDDHNYYFAPDYCALAASESVPFPTDENGYSLGQVIGVNKAEIAPRALALGTCSYRADIDITSNDKGSYIKYLKYLEYWNPYEVRTESQLRHIQQGCDNGEAADYKAKRTVTTIENDMNVAFKQSHDIKPTNSLNPIGKILKPKGFNGNYNGEISDHTINNLAFHGTYDGQSYRIIDAQFVEDDKIAAGLFAEADHATLQNIILFHEADSVADFKPLVYTASSSPSTTAKFIGGIAAIVRNTTVENCVVSGYNITAQNLIKKAFDLNNGGLVDSSIGGIVGALDYFLEDETNHPFYNRVEYYSGDTKPYNKNSIRYCHANVSFEDAQVENLGGILGVDNSSLLKLYIENCYSIVHKGEKGIDPATYRIGGIVGEIYETCICRFRGCYSIFEGMPDKPKPGDKNYDAGVVNNVIYVHRMGLAQGDRWWDNSYKSENNQNYYVNDEGFANNADVGLNSGGDPVYMGEGVSYKDLLKKLIPLASDSNYKTAKKAANLADKTYIKAVEPIEQGQPGAYPLMAFTVDVTDGQTTNNETTDKIPYRPIYRNDFSTQGSDLGYENASLGKFVHYGPWPEVPGVVGDLVRGPLAGIFDVKTHDYNGLCAKFDGYMVYNRDGIFNKRAADLDDKELKPTVLDWSGTKFAGVFFCNPKFFDTTLEEYYGEDIDYIRDQMCFKFKDDGTIDDDRLHVFVNGEPVNTENIVLFEKYLKEKNAQGEYGVQGGSYIFKSQPAEGDPYTDEFFAHGKPNAEVNKAFYYYVLKKPDGTLYERDEIKSIRVEFNNGTKKGTLIKGDFDTGSLVVDPVPSAVDWMPEPKVIAFIASSISTHNDKYPYYVAPYVGYARMNGSIAAFGELSNNMAQQAYLCVAVPKEYEQYLEDTSQELLVNMNGAPSKLKIWGSEKDQADIANLDEILASFKPTIGDKQLNRSDYTIYYISNFKNFSRNNAFNGGPFAFSIQFGSKQLMHYVFGSSSNGNIGFQDGAGEAQKVAKSLMPKIGIGPLYYSPGKGYIRAGYFAAYNDPTKTYDKERPWISCEGYYNNDVPNQGETDNFKNAFKVSDKEFVLYLKGNDGETKSKDDLQKEINNNITVKLSGVTVLDSKGKPKTEKDPKDPSKDIKVTEVTLNQIKDIQFYNEDWQYDNKNTLAVKFSTPENIEITDNSVITVYYKQQPDVDAKEVEKDGEVIISQPISAFAKGKDPKDCIPKIALAGIYKEGESTNYLQGFVYDPADTTNEGHISEKGNLAGKTVEKLNRYVLAVDGAIAKDIDAKLVTVEVTRKVPNKDNPDERVTITIPLQIIKEIKEIKKEEDKPYKNITELGYPDYQTWDPSSNPQTYEIVLYGQYGDKVIKEFEEGDLIKVYYAGVQVMEKKVSKFYTPK